jgi:hypothetical protein
MVIIIEAGLNAVSFILESNKKENISDERYYSPYFRDKEWAKTLFEELDELKGSFKKFRHWGKDEFHGKYVNINKEGKRKTWNYRDFHEEETKKIYVFGGSLAWGDAARDEHTIPSYMSKILYNDGHRFLVYNYGEWAYTNTQAIIYLILLLRNGHRPDYVIFYSGTDVYSSYQSGSPGTLHYAYLFREKGKELSDFQHIRIGMTNLIRRYSRIYGELTKIKNKLNPPASQFQEAAHNFSDNELRELSVGIVNYIDDSFKLVEKLSEAYGFKYLFFWAPVAFTENKLLDEEKDLRLNDESLRKLYRYTKEDVDGVSIPHFYDISDALAERTKAYYLDSGHITEEGNEVIAKKIVSIFEKEYLNSD